MNDDTHAGPEPRYKIIAGPTELDQSTTIRFSNECANVQFGYRDASGDVHLLGVSVRVDANGPKMFIHSDDALPIELNCKQVYQPPIAYVEITASGEAA